MCCPLPIERSDPLTRSAFAADPADPATLAQLYGALVFKAAYRVLGDASLAEDVQQDVFLRLIESPRQRVESWPAYLTAASTRAAIDVLRRQQRWWRLLPLWRAQAPDSAASAEQAGLEAERARRLRAALARLSRREAQCFSLRYLQGLDIADIARALQLSENSVSVTLHRAKRRLEAHIEHASQEGQS